MKKLKVLMLSDPIFRSSGYGNTNLSQLPYLSQIFDMSYLAWGWTGLEPTYQELAKAFPTVEFYPALGEYHGRDVLHHVVQKAQPDIILLHGDIYMFADTMAEQLSQYRGKICQLALYPIDGENIPVKWIPFMEKLDGLIALTEFAKKETQKAVRAPVRVANLGIDPNIFFPLSPEEKIRIRAQKFAFMNDKFVVTWIGRNFSRKNPGLAVMGFAQWVKKAKVKNALLYMHCSDSDPAGNSILEIVRRDLPHVADMVCMPDNYNIGSGVSRRLLAELIQCSDVGLNTSLGEGWGMPLTETMACGVPMIAPAHSACMEQIGANEERGELIKVAASFHASNNILQHIGDPTSLANKLDQLYSNQNRWTKKAKAGHEWASKMTWERSSRQLVEAMLEFHNQFTNEIPRSKMELM
jgi:glycosyltransferase involved in cell wall biosynthesis